MSKNSQEKIDSIISAYLLGTISTQQQTQLQEWLEAEPDNKEFFNQLCTSYRFQENYGKYKEIDYKKAMNQFVANHQTRKTVALTVKPFFRYAAVLLLLLTMGWGAYYLSVTKTHETQMAETLIEPGSAKAILILNNGSKIALNSESTKSIQSGGNTLATNSPDGINYSNEDKSITEYNTLYIPRGGEYRITLSDGTKVHLNSSSELRYPVSFDSNKPREVYLKGEGYFEVAKNAKRAFIVHVGDLNVKQYGTAFNINSYSESSIEVVLVHGSIGVQSRYSQQERRLKISQLAKYNSADKSISIKNVDIEPYIAWNNGMFNFENEDLADIMNTLSLWYDVDVQFNKNELKTLRFTGSLNRSIPINGILDAIESTTAVQISLKGRKIIIN